MSCSLNLNIVLCFIFIYGGVSNVSAQETNIDAQLKQRAVNFNAKLPVHVDNSTIWEKTSAGPGKRFTHFYKMTDFSATSDTQRTAFANSIRPDVLRAYCTGMKSLINNDVTISFQYTGNDGKLITDVVLTPRDCR